MQDIALGLTWLIIWQLGAFFWNINSKRLYLKIPLIRILKILKIIIYLLIFCFIFKYSYSSFTLAELGKRIGLILLFEVVFALIEFTINNIKKGNAKAIILHNFAANIGLFLLTLYIVITFQIAHQTLLEFTK